MWDDFLRWALLGSLAAFGAAVLGLISPKHAGLTSRWHSVIILVLAVILLGIGTSNSDFWKSTAPSGYPSSWDGHEYEVIEVEEISSGTRDRVQVRILAPTADTSEDRVATAMDAALEVYAITQFDLVAVMLEANPLEVGTGNVLATADYAPDGCGVSGTGDDCTGLSWTNLQASVWTNAQLEFKNTWQSHLEDFEERIGEGNAWYESGNEERLEEFLAERFNTTPADIRELLRLPVNLQKVELPYETILEEEMSFLEMLGALLVFASMAIALALPVLLIWPSIMRWQPILLAIGLHPWLSIMAGGVLVILGVGLLPETSLLILLAPFFWVICLTVFVTVALLKAVGAILNKLSS